MNRKDKAYRLARLIQQASRTIDSKKKMISKSAFRYEPYPAKTHYRKNKITDLRAELIAELMKELLQEDYNPASIDHIWVRL